MPSAPLYAEPHVVASVDDCYFYHRMEIPGFGVVGGDWDLRGREDDYLGGVELEGRRVLEIGPANGFLTFAMERKGAEVVAVDLPAGSKWDMIPHAALDPAEPEAWMTIMRQMRNGFWLAHERESSRARVHYGSAYDLPDELGHFDVALMAAVLLHTRDPLGVLTQCAARSDRLIVTDMHVPELDGKPVQQLFPTRDVPQWHTWWRFSPELFQQYFDVLGFDTTSTTFHEQTHVAAGVEYPMAMMTLVADRR